MKITRIGIDLAKKVFQIHGVDERGGAAQRAETERPGEILCESETLFDRHGSMWQRASLGEKLGEYRHTVKLIAPQFVKLYAKTNKNDWLMPKRFAKQ